MENLHVAPHTQYEFLLPSVPVRLANDEREVLPRSPEFPMTTAGFWSLTETPPAPPPAPSP
ncbi:hypothetical protein K443DRAFT_367569 [Laccaria amethystina LaAM-08-1]|uniref:Uncharacterized protein n=1 Tax=Laccaria amethystina LaAM-08-1 TaxID=1095629 RepID=A0A0C9YAV4_9AGAR|nr:hypothetical protein K443DRAFT_367569 [Laccaria amethystina LaAM-08-1]